MTKEVNIRDSHIMSYSPTYQSDYAPQLPDAEVSSAQAIRQSQIDRIE